MGGKRKSSTSTAKSFFSSLFKFSGRSHPARDVEEAEPRHRGRVWASDEDRGRWVGEPDIDRKATEFIANFHRNRVAESEVQAITVPF